MKLRSTVNVHMTANLNNNQLHFNHRLPSLRLPAPRGLAFTEPNLILRSPANRQGAASFLARVNGGQCPIELSNPVQSFRTILEKLTQIEGLVSVNQSNSYEIEFNTAKLFNSIEIGRTLANLITTILLRKTSQFSVAAELITDLSERRRNRPAALRLPLEDTP